MAGLQRRPRRQQRPARGGRELERGGKPSACNGDFFASRIYDATRTRGRNHEVSSEGLVQ